MRSTGVRVVLSTMVLLVLTACSPTTTRDRPARTEPEPTQTARIEAVPVSFDVPEGFSRTSNYTILVPLHEVRTSQWVVPTGELGLDVIAVTSYVLGGDVTDTPEITLVSALDDYARKVAAISATAPVPTTVAGYRAFQQSIEQPSSGGPLAYDATFVFSGQFMVQVLCQHRERPDVIRAGCATVLASLKLNFS